MLFRSGIRPPAPLLPSTAPSSRRVPEGQGEHRDLAFLYSILLEPFCSASGGTFFRTPFPRPTRSSPDWSVVSVPAPLCRVVTTYSSPTMPSPRFPCPSSCPQGGPRRTRVHFCHRRAFAPVCFTFSPSFIYVPCPIQRMRVLTALPCQHVRRRAHFLDGQRDRRDRGGARRRHRVSRAVGLRPGSASWIGGKLPHKLERRG